MELIDKKDALHAVLHNTGDAAVAAVENIKGIEMPADFMKRDNKTISFTGLLHSLRTNGFCNEQCEDCQESMEIAADELEKLLQDYASLSGKYDEARDRCNLAEKQLFFIENLVRCGNCKYWHEVDDVDGTTYGECKRPHPIIRKHIFLNSGWFCADGERKDGDIADICVKGHLHLGYDEDGKDGAE